MSIVPYALRPKAVIRKTALKRGVDGGGVFWRALAIYFVGGTTLLRTNAIRRGLIGGHRRWRAVGLLLVLTQDVRKSITRQPEAIATERLKPGQFVNVRVERPLSAKQRKRTGTTRKVLEARALADVAAAKGTDSAS